MHGNRRQLLVRTADTEAGCTLPFVLVNETPLLLAFRQPGCMHWDLLAAGESTDYVLDQPGGARSLLTLTLTLTLSPSLPHPHPSPNPHPHLGQAE